MDGSDTMLTHQEQARAQGAGDLAWAKPNPKAFVVIGLCGEMGSGKSTAADFLHRSSRFRRLSFAAPLKNMLRVLGLGDRELYGDLKETPSPKLGGHTPRHAMQTLGTEWGRDCMSPTFWVDQAIRSAIEARDCGQLGVVFDDVRFETEVDAIRLMGGRVIRLTGRAVASSGPKHASEQLDFEPDATISNAGSIADLERALMKALA
jgi:hypothetical protein